MSKVISKIREFADKLEKYWFSFILSVLISVLLIFTSNLFLGNSEPFRYTALILGTIAAWSTQLLFFIYIFSHRFFKWVDPKPEKGSFLGAFPEIGKTKKAYYLIFQIFVLSQLITGAILAPSQVKEFVWKLAS